MLQTQHAKQDTSHKFTRSSVLGATGLRWFTVLGFEAQKSYLGLRGSLSFCCVFSAWLASSSFAFSKSKFGIVFFGLFFHSVSSINCNEFPSMFQVSHQT